MALMEKSHVSVTHKVSKDAVKGFSSCPLSFTDVAGRQDRAPEKGDDHKLKSWA